MSVKNMVVEVRACDLCGQELKVREYTRKCVSCDRDVCYHCLDLHCGLADVCEDCGPFVEPFLNRLTDLRDKYKKDCEAVFRDLGKKARESGVGSAPAVQTDKKG